MSEETKRYNCLPTMQEFHACPAAHRALVGEVGSGKSTGAAWELCYYVPRFMYDTFGKAICAACGDWNWVSIEHGGQCSNPVCGKPIAVDKKKGFERITSTRFAIIRNTQTELRLTTQKTVFDWFPFGQELKRDHQYTFTWKDYQGGNLDVELLFLSCDNPDDMKKFKSLELTGYWSDESIEIAEEVKRMLKTRIGRFPTKSPYKCGIETTNPPDVEHPVYSNYKWHRPPPGPLPTGQPLEGHVGFWQPPRENQRNLDKNYYNDLRAAFRDNPDWINSYLEGKPGAIVKGRLVYANFRQDYHVAKEPLIWTGGELYRGWDNTGNNPACVVLQLPSANMVQVLREFWTDGEGIVDFTRRVVVECNRQFPSARFTDYADPAGGNRFSRQGGGFTSNAELMKGEGVKVIPSEQNFATRINVVDQLLGRIDGLLIDLTCTRLINGFVSGYVFPEIGTTGTYGPEAVKNKWSHPQDSLQYVLVRLFRNLVVTKLDKIHQTLGNRRPATAGSTSWMGM